MPNFHTPWIDKPAPGYTLWKASSMNPALAGLDRGITYLKNVMVHTQGEVTYAAGTLTWAGTIQILFTTAAGLAVRNTIAAGNIAVSAGNMVYVDLSETNNAVLTMQTASITLEAESNFKAFNRLVIGIRNPSVDEFYPVYFPRKYVNAIDKALFGANSILAANTAGAPACLEIAEQRIVGRKTGGNIDGLTGADVLILTGSLDGRQQEITCADSVTIDWSAGGTAYMTFDRNTVAMTFSNPSPGKVYRLLLTQSAGGSDVITWSTSIKWRGGAVPTLSTDAGASDILTFVYINGSWYGDCSKAFS